jgi:RHS repeat-associated protein
VTDGAPTVHIFAGSRRIATKTGSSTTYYHPDHLGGLNIATGGTGNVTETTFYYPYGETRVNTGSVDLHYKFTGKEIDRESGLYYYGARYYDPVIGRFISPDSVVQSPGDPQTLNRYSYCRNNPLLYTDPSGHVFGIDDLIFIIIGATLGATMSAMTGGNIGLGALTGAISGGAFLAAGSIIASSGLETVVQAGSASAIMEASAIHFIAGATAGAINAGITGGNVGLNALEGGVSAGVAYGAAAELGLEPGAQSGLLSGLQPEQKFIANLGFQTTVGALSGGVTAKLAGGNFLQGMGQGAWTAAYGFIFNDAWELAVEDVLGPYRGQEASVYTNDPLIYSAREIQVYGVGSTFLNDYSITSFASGQAADGSTWIGVWGQGQTPSSWEVQKWTAGRQLTELRSYNWVSVPEGEAAHAAVTFDAFFHFLR